MKLISRVTGRSKEYNLLDKKPGIRSFLDLKSAFEDQRQVIDRLTQERNKLQKELQNYRFIIHTKPEARTEYFTIPDGSHILLLTKEWIGQWLIYKVYDPTVDPYSLADVYMSPNNGEMVLEDFFVTRMYQRKKIGSILMEKALMESRKLGMKKITAIRKVDLFDLETLKTFLSKFHFEVRIEENSQMACCTLQLSE